MSTQDNDVDPAAPVVSRRVRRRPGENRARLIEAGLLVFGRHGFHGASTAAIAELADVPQPHVYASFSTKQALFLECGKAAAQRLAARDLSRVLSQPLDEELRILGAFVLQSLASAGDAKLSAELQLGLGELCAAHGREHIAALITATSLDLLAALPASE